MATVNYIPCKKQCPASLVGVSNYVKQEKKTFLPEQNRYLISGQNCSAQFSQLEFLATRDQFRKTSSQYFYHYTQSFHPEEPVTGELAHTIAQEFAARAWPEKDYHLHTLRHYFVSTLLHRGIDRQTVANLAGHCDTSYLEQTYCHPQMELKQRAANQISEAILPFAVCISPMVVRH